VLILLASSLLVLATALLLAARVSDGSVPQWLVGAYVLAWTEVIVVSLALSIATSLTRWALFGALGGVFVPVAALTRGRGIPPVTVAARKLRPFLRDPAIVVLLVVVVGVVGYSIALGLFRPPNDGDALGYHLARAAFWRQQHAVDYIAGARDARLNTFAPNTEIGMAYTMVTSGTGRYAPLVQLAAALASALAVFGLARRIGAEIREAVIAGLLFVTLPVVALQMSTGLNDVIVGSFVVCAAFFLVERTVANAALAAVAIALGVGAKLTGALSLPGLALIALVAHGRKAFRPLVAVAAGIFAGAYWYWLDVARGTDITGGVTSERVPADVAAAVARVARLLLDTVELPGAIGLERLWFVFAAGFLAAVAVAQRKFRSAAVAAAFALAPLALIGIVHVLAHGMQKIYFELGRTDAGYIDASRSPTKASPIYSWYGPAAAALTILAVVLIFRRTRSGGLRRVALVVATAPVIWIVILGLGVPYWEWNGRYSIGGWAVGCAAWAVPLRIRPIASATVALALIAATLAFVHQHDRASGARLLAADHEPSVWSLPSWNIQATDHPFYAQLLRFVATRIPSHARVAIEPFVWPHSTFVVPWPSLPYPYFGPGLTRTVLFADNPARARALHAGWAVLRRDFGGCAAEWTRVFGYDSWVVLRATPGHTCS
jgi:hypothetical protein